MDIARAANGAFDMRAEVALISSNIVVTADDAAVTRAPGGEMFGGRIYANGPSVLRLSHALVTNCGQGGLLRAAVTLDTLTAVNPRNYPNVTLTNPPPPASATAIPNPSFVDSTAVTFSMDGGVELISASQNPIRITNNVRAETHKHVCTHTLSHTNANHHAYAYEPTCRHQPCHSSLPWYLCMCLITLHVRNFMCVGVCA